MKRIEKIKESYNLGLKLLADRKKEYSDFLLKDLMDKCDKAAKEGSTELRYKLRSAIIGGFCVKDSEVINEVASKLSAEGFRCVMHHDALNNFGGDKIVICGWAD